MTIKAIIFDIGGVLFPIQPWVGTRPATLHPYKKYIQDIYNPTLMSKKYLKDCLLKSSFSKAEQQAIYDSLTKIDTKLFTQIIKLSKSHTLYAIANEAPLWTETRDHIHKFTKYFTKIYISSTIGLKKPDPKIFEYFLKDTKLKSRNCLFIDDSPINTNSASNLGFQVYKYENYPKFKKYCISTRIL